MSGLPKSVRAPQKTEREVGGSTRGKKRATGRIRRFWLPQTLR